MVLDAVCLLVVIGAVLARTLTDHPVVERRGSQQLTMDDGVPAPGSRWLVGLDRSAAVVMWVDQRRNVWVTVRHRGVYTPVRLDEFKRLYRPHPTRNTGGSQ